MPKVAAYMLTRDRLDYTKRTLKSMYKKAGHPFDLYIFDNGSTDGTHEWIHTECRYPVQYMLNKKNFGQHIGANRAIKWIRSEDRYDFIMRVDNDCRFLSNKWLKKLLSAYKTLFDGKIAVISPQILGLNHPPQPYAVKSEKGHIYWFIEIVGGICRLHPTKLFDDFSFNERQALAFGEAQHLSIYCQDNQIPMCYIINLRAEHMDTTNRQVGRLPEYFERSEMERYLPYGL